MKILHVFLFFSVKHGGGTVDLIYKLARAQTRRGHEVTIYTGDYKFDKEYADFLEGVKVVPFKSWLNFGFYLMPSMVKEAKRKLQNFDIIHLHCYRSFQNMVIHHYAQKYGIPYVVDAHGSVPIYSRKRRIKQLFDFTVGFRILRDASRCIGETEVGVNEYKEYDVNPDKIVLLPPPYSTEEFSQLPPHGQFRHQFNIKEKHIVLFVGRINRIKGVDFLVESFYDLTQCRNDVILVMVGSDDGYKSILEDLINKLNLSNKVLFTGFVSEEEKLSALVDANVFVQVSRHEQGAWAPIEAVLCNTPVIVSSHTGAGEDVRKMGAGYLVEFGNQKELCDIIQKILDNPAEAAAKTQKAKSYIEANLSMAKRVVEYEELYAKCIEENKLAVSRGK